MEDDPFLLVWYMFRGYVKLLGGKYTSPIEHLGWELVAARLYVPKNKVLLFLQETVRPYPTVHGKQTENHRLIQVPFWKRGDVMVSRRVTPIYKPWMAIWKWNNQPYLGDENKVTTVINVIIS